MSTHKKFSLLAVFAHPDDESLMMGGTLAGYSRQGVEVSLVCATRGEWGSISDSTLATRESLAEVREQELHEACEVLGVRRLQFLDCPDGDINHTYWPDIEEKIVREIRYLRPHVVVTFGPDGLYGHPDHIAVSQLTTAAFTSAGEDCRFPEHLDCGLQPHQASKLYYAQFPENLMRDMLAAISKEHPGPHLWELDSDLFGVPEELITTIIDVRDEVLRKLQALRCHRTQLGPDNAFLLVSDVIARRFLAREHFRLVNSQGARRTLEGDLFEGLGDRATELEEVLS